jgi:methionyl-tRNA formyltransferase
MTAVPDWWKSPRVVTVVVDNDSWVLPYARRIVEQANAGGDRAQLVRRHDDIPEGSVAFYLGCVKIAPAGVLKRNRRNLVVHASDLPKGRGFSPLVWSILSGENRVAVCLIDAAEEVDAGPVVFKEVIEYEGHELNDELRAPLGEMHLRLCLRFLSADRPPAGAPQQGEPTVLRRRGPRDSRLDPGRTIAEQFDLLRVVDNDRYPAYFEFRGCEYVLRIEKRSVDGDEAQ